MDKTKETPFDLIMLDIILPGIDGFDVLRRLRSQHLAGRVLVLTARGEVKDRVTGLQLGADDYLPKPFAMRELVARVNALGRRYPEEPGLNLRVGDLTLDLATHDVHRGGERIDLSRRELMLLKVLMREPGRVFTRTELCERVWEHVHEYDTKLVEVFIGRLRKKIGDPSLIHTVRHVGYTTCESAIDAHGRTIWIADAHRGDGKRFVVRADEKLTAFLERESGGSLKSPLCRCSCVSGENLHEN